jgi:hypothetical protein
MATKAQKIQIPQLPNFICVGSHATGSYLPIGEFSDREIRSVAAEWSRALLAHARKRRSKAKKSLEGR